MHDHLNPHSPLVRRGRRKPGRLRVAMRRAQGIGPSDIARESDLPLERVVGWLKEPAFRDLVRACEAMLDLPDEERIAVLEREALNVLQIAVEECDVRVCLFIADCMTRDRAAHKVLARLVDRKVKQSTIPLDRPLSEPMPVADPAAARAASRHYRTMHPWADHLSTARRQLGEELARTIPSTREAPAKPAPARPAAPAPILAQLENFRIELSDLTPQSRRIIAEILAELYPNRTRDGP